MLLIELEAATLGLVGGLVGVALGWVALGLLARLPQTSSLVSDSLSAPLLVEAVLVAISCGVLAGFLPAWRGACLSPVEALRHD